MPFKSQAQRRYLFSQHPELAKEWQAKTPAGKKLPEKVKKAYYTDDNHPEYVPTPKQREAEERSRRLTQNVGFSAVGGLAGMAGGLAVGSKFFPKSKFLPPALGSLAGSLGGALLGRQVLKEKASSAMTPAGKKLPEKVKKAGISPTVVLGLVGAGGGAAYGALMDNENRLRGGIVGGLSGGISGALVGKSLKRLNPIRPTMDVSEYISPGYVKTHMVVPEGAAPPVVDPIWKGINERIKALKDQVGNEELHLKARLYLGQNLIPKTKLNSAPQNVMWAGYYDELDKIASDMQKEAIFGMIARGAGALAKGVGKLLPGVAKAAPSSLSKAPAALAKPAVPGALKIKPGQMAPKNWSLTPTDMANPNLKSEMVSRGMAPKGILSSPKPATSVGPGASLTEHTTGRGMANPFVTPKPKPFKPSFRPAMAMGAA